MRLLAIENQNKPFFFVFFFSSCFSLFNRLLPVSFSYLSVYILPVSLSSLHFPTVTITFFQYHLLQMPSLSLLSTLAFLFTAVACQDPSELSGLSIPTLQGLQEASQRVVDMATVQTFSISAIITWIAVYICSKLTWRILSRSYR